MSSTPTPEPTYEFKEFEVDIAGARNGIKNINFSKKECFSEVVAFGAEKASRIIFKKEAEKYIVYGSVDGGMDDDIITNVLPALSKSSNKANGSKSGVGLRTALHNIYAICNEKNILPYFTNGPDKNCWGIINKCKDKYTFIAFELDPISDNDWNMTYGTSPASTEHKKIYDKYIISKDNGVLYILPNILKDTNEFEDIIKLINLHSHKRIMNGELQFEHDYLDSMKYVQPLVPDKGLVFDSEVKVYHGNINGASGRRHFYKFKNNATLSSISDRYNSLNDQLLHVPSGLTVTNKRDSTKYEWHEDKDISNLKLYTSIPIRAAVLFGNKDYDTNMSNNYKNLYGIEHISDLIGTWVSINNFNFMSNALDKEAMKGFMRGGDEAARYKPIIEFKLPEWDEYMKPEQNKSKCDLKRCEPWLETLSYIIQGFLREVADDRHKNLHIKPPPHNDSEDSESEDNESEDSELEDSDADDNEDPDNESSTKPNIALNHKSPSISPTNNNTPRYHYSFFQSNNIDPDIECVIDKVDAVKVGISDYDISTNEGWCSTYSSFTRCSPYLHIIHECYPINSEMNNKVKIEQAFQTKLKNAGFKFINNSTKSNRDSEWVIIKGKSNEFLKLWEDFKTEYSKK